jgi:hypothetical protein
VATRSTWLVTRYSVLEGSAVLLHPKFPYTPPNKRTDPEIKPLKSLWKSFDFVLVIYYQGFYNVTPKAPPTRKYDEATRTQAPRATTY